MFRVRFKYVFCNIVNCLWDEYNAEKADLQLKGLWNDKEGLQALLNQSYTASNNEDLSGMLLVF